MGVGTPKGYPESELISDSPLPIAYRLSPT